MKTQRAKTLGVVFLALLMWPLTSGRSQEAEEYKSHPGYFDLSSVPSLGETESTVEIFFTPGLAKLLGAMEDGDPASENVLSALKLIKVYTFDARTHDRARLEQKIDELSKKLLLGKWERFLRAQEKRERAEIFTKTEGRKIQGVVILSIDNKEAAFVNIVGTLDFQSLGKLSKKLDIPQLDSLKSTKP
jgi:hypothetical protein